MESNTNQAQQSKDNKNNLLEVRETIGRTKEKIVNFIDYQRLKLKERFGTLDAFEFNDLLEHDFMGEMKDNPPFYGAFSRLEEGRKIEVLPKGSEESKRANIDYNIKEHRQDVAIASCRLFIQREIENNNDVRKEYLMYWVNKFGRKYGFDEDILHVDESIVDNYYMQRSLAKETIEKYPNKSDLIEFLTGTKVDDTGKIEVTLGPMSVDLATDSKTFANIYRNFDVNSVPNAGFACSKPDGDKEVFFTVLDADKNKKGKSKTVTQKHEWEHIFFGMYQNALGLNFNEEESNKLLNLFESATDNIEKKFYLESWMKQRRQFALQNSKNEIFAMAKQGNYWDDKLFFPKIGIFVNTGGLTFKKYDAGYDYLKKDRDVGKMDKKLAHRIFVKEYKKIIKSGVNSYWKLHHQGKMKTGMVVSLLYSKPIELWPVTVERYLEWQKKSKRTGIIKLTSASNS